ncbi:5'/3'-nucleotidase SurE [Metarhizium guizhouense ARSEF 977]|uniref:5'/3'-nucleotidase SurE n=1 Tax=Metarhizium guizhouense (strain ARSEF 977) TaxID=1276136 RepID=A0A0B4H3I3_METGA|nr:5'/3'-nucleotidase SurE [Metarhizium guizhouense ARSEF 977]
MHILVTNDDGPPSPESSPYVHCLVRQLQQAGHTVSVCLPHTQRSWIGKAYMIGQTLKRLYYQPGTAVHDASKATLHQRPSPTNQVEGWILLDGNARLLGPNYGRNSTAVYALSSGTIGAAMEAAVCRKKSIALSFAFFSRKDHHAPAVIEAACRHGVKVIEALYKQWPQDGSVDLYSVNVPLVGDVESCKTFFADMLQNKWEGSCFEEVEDEAGDTDVEEARIREGPDGEASRDGSWVPGTGHLHRQFKWAPRVADVRRSVDESEPGNDGWILKQGHTSVTPLKASFALGGGALSRKELLL